ncbi:MAG: bacteriohopanetetrol glucosamine biosynthesis glycosyltransferase HpnI [Desulfobacteraceae bacterium]|nr:bacteriohopanetetrol glucosamine biosynthesis glycosyltransferase HpnI [Desulfobacteraceae bacterium]
MSAWESPWSASPERALHMMLVEPIRLVFGILTAASICYFFVSILAARRFFSSPPAPALKDCPPVSILIPLCGADFRAYENYAALCRQDYPEFQIIFGVRDPMDSSVALIAQLKKDFPEVRIDLVVSPGEIGPNPKVNNLNNMYPFAVHDVLALLDSDILVGRDFLRSVVSELDHQKGGVVTCIYTAGAAPGLATKLEAVGISSEFAPGVLIAQMSGSISFAFGAAIVMTRKAFDSIGAFPAIAAYLADDYMIGNLANKAGFPVTLSRYVVRTVLSKLSLKGFWRHQVRWARGIRACNKWGHTGSLITNGTALSFLYLAVCGFSPFGWLVFLGTLALRLATARAVGVNRLGDSLLARNLWLVPIRDFFSLFIWCAAIGGKRVEWRGQVFRLQSEGKMVPESRP